MSFTRSFWQDIQPILDAIRTHPFINELAGGSLERERFVFYMQQDALYLQDFSRALAIAGARLPEVSEMQAFLEFASGAVTVESSLHETYFERFGVTLEGVEKAPACFAYTQFLLARAAHSPVAEAISALLPCFWIYREVGNEIHTNARAGLAENPYARWIETYSGEAFSRSVDRAIATCESTVAEASAADQELARRAFRQSARLEWMFWDSAYRLERWQPE